MKIPTGQHDCPVFKFLPSLLAAVFLLLPVGVHANVCEPQCHTGRGICVSGQCFCHSPWGGDGCSSVVSGAPPVPAASDVGFTLPALALAEPAEGTAEGETTLNRPLPTLQSTALPQPSDGQEQEQEPVEAAPELMRAGPDDAGVPESGPLPNLQSRKSLRPLAVVQQASAGQMDDADKRPSFLAQSQADPQPFSAAGTVGELVEPTYSVVGISNPGRNVNIKDQPENSLVHRFAQSDVGRPYVGFGVVHNGPLGSDAGKRLLDEATARIPDEQLLKKRIALRDARASLRHDLEQLNAHANMLKLTGDPVAKAVLRDLNPVRGDLQLVGGKAKSKAYVLDSTICIAAPLSVQGILLAFLLVFAAIDHCSKSTVDGEMHRSSWTCGCCLHVSRFIVSIQWHTIAFAALYLLVMNGTWAVMCQNGTASDYLSTVGIYAYLAFAILGLLFLILGEIYLRCAERVRRFEALSANVSNLVGLLDVKYGKQLQKRTAAMAQRTTQAGAAVWDKVDDVTDAMGVTECSSDDDVSCWNGCRAPGPKKPRV